MFTSLRDPAYVLLSLIVVAILVRGARTALGRGAASSTVRRALHVGVGLWTVFVTPRFTHLAWALVPPIAFLVVNGRGALRAMVPGLEADGSAGSRRGLWTFPLGVSLAYLFFWEPGARREIVAACAILALADPAAALVGSRFGQRRFHPFGHGRTLEGSLAFFVVAAAIVGLVAAGDSTAVVAWRLSIGCAVSATVAEALSPPGWDNAAIPVVAATAYNLLS